jgi:DNA-directed RNA polymerase subunit beta'
LNILYTLPADNQYLDFDPNKFVAKMGAGVYYGFISKYDLDQLSYQLRDIMLTRETSKQRKTEALKDYKLLNLSVSLT